jgi:hypothetical protein
MTQTSGTFPALSDGVGAKKAPKKKKRMSAVPGTKAKLDRLAQKVCR